MSKRKSVISSTITAWNLQGWVIALLLLAALFLLIITYVPGVERQAVALAISTISVIGLFAPWRDKSDQVVSYLNRSFPQLENSVQLLQSEPEAGLAQLQYNRVNERIAGIPLSKRMPHKWVVPLALLLIAVATTSLVPSMQPASGTTSVVSVPTASSAPEAFAVNGAELRVIPPSYTKMPPVVISDSTTLIPEGSTLHWDLTFSKPVKAGWIQFNTDTTHFSQTDKLNYDHPISNSGITGFRAEDAEANQVYSPLFSLIVLRDQAPQVQILELDQYSFYQYNDEKVLNFIIHTEDDYGVTNASILATVSSGSGESVQFRERKIDLPNTLRGKNSEIKFQINLDDYELGPGDELYFHAEVQDNKPDPQTGRTPTYFAQVKDTTELLFSLEGDLGVDLMPEYFRSQRQIIIDTEKLIKEKSTITREEFALRSNALGFDQKSLRLKYGQFIGIEDESGIAVQETAEEAPEIEDFMHDHDNETEGTHDHEHEPSDGHDHEHDHEHEGENNEGSSSESPLEQFLHDHGDAETATFFGLALKAKLRIALKEMWDAELYLRLFKPEESLPYQYRALKMIKEIKNDARVYVHRVGFEPAPIKEDIRLTGEMDGRARPTRSATVELSSQYPATRKAIFMLVDADTLTKELTAVLKTAQAELTIDTGGTPCFSGVQLIDNLLRGEASKEAIAAARKQLLNCLPDELPAIHRRTQSNTLLKEELINDDE